MRVFPKKPRSTRNATLDAFILCTTPSGSCQNRDCRINTNRSTPLPHFWHHVIGLTDVLERCGPRTCSLDWHKLYSDSDSNARWYSTHVPLWCTLCANVFWNAAAVARVWADFSQLSVASWHPRHAIHIAAIGHDLFVKLFTIILNLIDCAFQVLNARYIASDLWPQYAGTYMQRYVNRQKWQDTMHCDNTKRHGFIYNILQEDTYLIAYAVLQTRYFATVQWA
jgi:hypothetical protein